MSNQEVTELPVPTPPQMDLDTKFFWDGLQEGKFLLQRCTSCDRVRFPPMPMCPHCRASGGDIQEMSGKGTVYSWVVAERAFAPEFAADVPYVLATIDFDEGFRAVFRFEGGPQTIDFNSRVESIIVDHQGWSELRVKLAEG